MLYPDETVLSRLLPAVGPQSSRLSSNFSLLYFEILSGLSCVASAKQDGHKDAKSEILSGGHSVGETPVLIPNTEVKPHSADGTAFAGE